MCIRDRDVAVVILTEKFGREFPEVVNEARQGHSLPLLIEIPVSYTHLDVYKRQS